jgi:hypothetical protein
MCRKIKNLSKIKIRIPTLSQISGEKVGKSGKIPTKRSKSGKSVGKTELKFLHFSGFSGKK